MIAKASLQGYGGCTAFNASGNGREEGYGIWWIPIPVFIMESNSTHQPSTSHVEPEKL